LIFEIIKIDKYLYIKTSHKKEIMDDDEIKLSEIFFIPQKIANKRVVLLVGPKESGKTTFLYYLNGLSLNKHEND
jgi:polynucleotide 5'-kinase involved in rRNA processing